MHRLKNRHFTLRRACTHLDHLAAHIHGDVGTLKPVCAYNKDRSCFWGGGCPFTPQHQGLAPNFLVISKIKDKRKHPRLRPLLQFTEEKEVRRNATGRGMKEGNEGGGHLNTGLNTAVKKGRHRRKEVNERRVDLTGRLFLRPE